MDIVTCRSSLVGLRIGPSFVVKFRALSSHRPAVIRCSAKPTKSFDRSPSSVLDKEEQQASLDHQYHQHELFDKPGKVIHVNLHSKNKKEVVIVEKEAPAESSAPPAIIVVDKQPPQADWEVWAAAAKEWWTNVGRLWLADIIVLRVVEDPNAKWEPAPWVPKAYYPELRGRALLDADVATLRAYMALLDWWVSSYRVPLQPDYDPTLVAAYFRRRPHLLLARLMQVAFAAGGVLGRYLIELAAAQASKRDGTGETGVGGQLAAVERAALTLKRALTRLGPTFVKVAQSLSARPDVVGEGTAKVLSELQDRLPPFPKQEAMAVIEEELGRPASAVFAELSEEPVAAASFGQVYRGMTTLGTEVAVKVQRPRLLQTVALDIYILRLMLRGLRQLAGINTDLGLLADELGVGLYGELDYLKEAANATAFDVAHRQLSYVVVPKALPDATTRRVLTMQWLEGERPSDLIADVKKSKKGSAEYSTAQSKLLGLVERGVECSLVQLLETGVMHADPHPGNFLLLKDGRIGYLDFGLLTQISSKHRSAMLAAIAHLVNAEWSALTEDLDSLDVLKPETNRADVTLALATALGGGERPLVTGQGMPYIRFGQVTSGLWKIALRFRFRLPPYYTLILRSLASLEGIGLSADPDFKVFASAYPHVLERLLTDNTSTSRHVLKTLLFDTAGRLRTDRIAAFAATLPTPPKTIPPAERQLSKTILPGVESTVVRIGRPGVGLPVEGGPKELALWAAGVLLDKRGAGVRRILLESDLANLAESLLAKQAGPLRKLLAEATAYALYLRLTGRPFAKHLGDAPLESEVEDDAIIVTSAPFSGSRGTKSGPVMSAFEEEKATVGEEVLRRMQGRRLRALLKGIATKLKPAPQLRWRLAVAFVGFVIRVAKLLVQRVWSGYVRRLRRVLVRFKGRGSQEPAIEATPVLAA